MSRLLPALLLLLFAAPARADQLWEKLVPLGLQGAGDVETIQVELQRRAILVVFLLGPEEAAAGCGIAVRDPKGEAIDISRMPALAAGTYKVEVRAGRDLSIAPTARIVAYDALDRFAPNATWEEAARASPPLRAWILLEYNRNDWFRIDADESGVLSIHFTRPLGGPDIWFSLLDAERKTLWSTKERWDWEGARYFPVEKGKTYYMSVTPGRARTAWAELELGLYRASDLASAGKGAAGRILVVGLDTDSPDLDQLRQISRAAGKPLTSTVAEDVEAMTAELVEDVQRPEPEPEPEPATPPKAPASEEGGEPGALAWIVSLLAVAAGALFVIFHRRRRD